MNKKPKTSNSKKPSTSINDADFVFFASADNEVKLFNLDAIQFLRTLPDKSVDLIVTDPAYSGMNQHLKLGKGRIVGKYSEKETSGKWFDEFHDTEENYRIFLNECFRVLKDNRHIYIMFDSFSLISLAPIVRTVFDLKNIVVWDKVNMGMGHYFRRRHEFILFACKGKKPLTNRATPDVWRIKRLSSAKYPTQKPVELFDCMLSGSSEQDYVVCDPFVGSGSSMMSAIKHGCKFIGNDISKNALKMTSDRYLTIKKTMVDKLQPSSMLLDGEKYNWLIQNGKLI